MDHPLARPISPAGRTVCSGYAPTIPHVRSGCLFYSLSHSAGSALLSLAAARSFAASVVALPLAVPPNFDGETQLLSNIFADASEAPRSLAGWRELCACSPHCLPSSHVGMCEKVCAIAKIREQSRTYFSSPGRFVDELRCFRTPPSPLAMTLWRWF